MGFAIEILIASALFQDVYSNILLLINANILERRTFYAIVFSSFILLLVHRCARTLVKLNIVGGPPKCWLNNEVLQLLQ